MVGDSIVGQVLLTVQGLQRKGGGGGGGREAGVGFL